MQYFVQFLLIDFVSLDLQNSFDVGAAFRKTFAPGYHLIKLIRI